SEIVSKTGKGKIQFHTSNAKTKDGLRDGCVIYDEVHEYLNSDIVDVFSSGIGKIRHSRESFISIVGFDRREYLVDLTECSINVLKSKAPNDHLLVFMARIDDEKEMDDMDNWQKANPMFHEPMSDYARELHRIVTRQYVTLGNSKPSARIRFMTKRMN